jgi:predicted dehydrogenase
MTKISVAVIGLGRVGSDYDAGARSDVPRSHIGAVRRDPRFELAAVCDSDSAACERFRSSGGERTSIHTSLDSLLTSASYDIIVVATPPQTHAEILKACVQAKTKAVFCEKPMGSNASEAAEIAVLYEAAGIPLVVNYQRRWDQRIRVLRDRLSQAGRARGAQFFYVKGLRNYGAHAVDLLRSLFGEIATVHALPPASRGLADPSLSANLAFTNGLTASLIGFDDLAYEVFDLDILTEQARFRVEFGGQSIRRQVPEPGRFFPGYISLSKEARLVPDGPVSGLAQAYDELAAWMLEGQRPTTSTAANAVSVQRVLDAIVASAANGAQVTL